MDYRPLKPKPHTVIDADGKGSTTNKTENLGAFGRRRRAAEPVNAEEQYCNILAV